MPGDNQKGFTFIELTIVLAICSLISLGIVTSTIQVVQGSHENRNHLTAIEQLQNVYSWISKDAVMAQEVLLGENAGFPLTLRWREFGHPGDRHEIVYSIYGDGLERQEYVDRVNNPDPVAATIVAQNVDLTGTSCALDDRELTLNVAVRTIGASTAEKELRTYEIACRPDINTCEECGEP
jgi:prepilin-type N-terminal cleavage/methylation domain-containing protein